MKNVMNVFMVTLLTIGVAVMSCGPSAGDTPGATAKKFNELVAAGDADNAMKLMKGYEEFSEDEKEKFKTMVQEAANQMDEQGGIASFEVTEENIDEDSDKATVTITTTYGDGETEESRTSLVKVDDQWRVAMDK